MKKYYFLLIYLLSNATIQSQVINGGWNEDFDNMTVNQPPNSGWLASSNFTVLPTPHGGQPQLGDNGSAISCHLNYGIQNDSVFTPLLTGWQYGASGFTFNYRICNWFGNTIISPATLSNDDTCSLSFYKYSGTNLTAIIPIHKIHSGNHPTDSNFTFWPTYLFTNVSYSDTFRIAIHIKKGVLGSYWYDFDKFLAAAFTNINEASNSNKIYIYPNPAKNKLSFKLDSPIKNIQLSDIYGKLIEFNLESNQDTHQIHLHPSIASGIYFISIKTDKEIINSKFLKE